jgi:hypothetical protein
VSSCVKTLQSENVSNQSKFLRCFPNANSIIDFEELNLEYSELEIAKLCQQGLIFPVTAAKYQRM